MKTLRFFLMLLLSVVFVPLISCDDDDDDSKPTITRTDTLTAAEWTGNSLFAGQQDITQLVKDSIEYDVTKDRIKFNKNGTFTDVYEGITITGKWKFIDNEQKIMFDENTDDEYTVTVNKLTNSELYLLFPGELFDLDMDIEARYKR